MTFNEWCLKNNKDNNSDEAFDEWEASRLTKYYYKSRGKAYGIITVYKNGNITAYVRDKDNKDWGKNCKDFKYALSFLGLWNINKLVENN